MQRIAALVTPYARDIPALHLDVLTNARTRALIMVALTLAYLMFELGFSARLLDVVGGLATPDEVRAIQQWGRVISGIALGLAIWGGIILPAAGKHKLLRDPLLLIPILAAVACGSIAFTWHFEGRLVHNLVENSSGSTRRLALQSQAVSTAVLVGVETLKGIDLGSADQRPPESHAIIALFSSLALRHPHMAKRFEPLMKNSHIVDALSKLSNFDARFKEAWKRYVAPQCDALRASYESANKDYRRALDAVPAYQLDEWQTFVSWLAAHGLTPDSARPYAAQIIIKMNAKDIRLPPTWTPNDEAAFKEEIGSRVWRRADAAFAQRTAAIFGAPLQPNLKWEAVSGSPVIVGWMRKHSSLPQAKGLSCAPDLGSFKEAVSSVVVPPILTAHAKDFDNGGRYEAYGRTAFAAVIVPPIAFVFSTIGALTHTFKVLWFGSIAVFPRAKRRLPIVAAVVLGLLVLPLFHTNSITHSDGFHKLEHVLAKQGAADKAIGFGAKWLIQIQHVFYPANAAIRSRLLGGFAFNRPLRDDAEEGGQ